ncbi:MAG: AraC family transcriptional regulator [Verrucomicrobia bacterium]|nr:AraC family transcriptional regulator [Verrucomicrobiota bacterium]
MTSSSGNYFRYLPPSLEARNWGLCVTASGCTRIPARAGYPLVEHPEDHHLDWERGRVLDSLQIVLILSGSGWIETRATGRLRVKAGMVILLLPKTWHRYKPDAQTGWDESWIEVQGPLVDGLLEAGVFPMDTILRARAIDVGLEEILDSIHQRIRKKPVGFQPELSAAALHVLSLCALIAPMQPQLSRIQHSVNEAERYLNDHHAEPINIEALAKRLGVAYSHFRRAFRAQTGFAPWQYVMHLRLTRARRLLASSDAKLYDVAARVGFSSGFHLSFAFKRAFGQSPDVWRQTLFKS